jgi:putative membrane protein|tara:strand:- start:122 stop:985 length:864 start_codon:yes stop_codon:yes gene_type:complete
VRKEQWLWLIKGAAMGAADAVPGVSGGTIALITGIYERFIGALASFRPSLWRFIRVGDFRGLWQAIDGQFLAFLGAGILISLFSVLSLMDFLLATAAPVVWSFFMGVILVSLWQLSRGRSWLWQDAALLMMGLAISLVFATATGMPVTVTPLTLVLGGMLAISAMLLPGISGSFMLVLLGLYPVVVEAVHERNLPIVLWVALGCAIGIVSFSRFLQWLLHNWHERVISFMLGFVAGALVKVWPWQDSGRWLLPEQYSASSGLENWFLLSLVSMFLGVVIGNFMKNKA